MLPRPIRPLSTYLLTRRCVERLFLLRPSTETNNIVKYCLATAATKTGVEVHVFCAMSNHHHCILTDIEGRLPEFMQLFHRHLAVALNTLHKRSGNLWSGEQTSLVELGDKNDVLEKMAYVLCNPTTAGLVHSPQNWPGVISHRLGEEFQVSRPRQYFKSSGTMPEQAGLTFSLPPQLKEMGMREANQQLFARLAHKVEIARSKVQEKNHVFLGVKGVLKTSIHQSPLRETRRCSRTPRFSIRNPSKFKEAVERWRSFLLAYIDALASWKAGNRMITFPDGTWLMKHSHNAACAPPPGRVAPQ